MKLIKYTYTIKKIKPPLILDTPDIKFSLNFKLKMKYIFLTGKASLQTLTLIFRQIFHEVNFEAKAFKFQHKLSSQLTVCVDCDLDKIDFDLNKYKEQITQIKNLKAIICLDTLNPRPEKLFKIFEIIKSVFNLNELNTKTHFMFYASTDQTISLESFRRDAFQFDLRLFLHCSIR